MFKEIGKGFLAVIIGVVVICALTFGGLAYRRYFAPKSQSIDREVFKETKSYNEGMVQDLSKDKLELSQTKDKDARKAIVEHIIEKYSNFDENRIENRELRNFLIEIKNGDVE